MTLKRKTNHRLTNEEIISGFRNNNPEIIEKIYINHFPMIKRLVVFNSGTPSDAKDIFQESLMIIYKKIENDEFVLHCSFKTFLFSISRNIWYKQLRNNKVHFNEFQDNTMFVEKTDNKSYYFKELFSNKEYFLFRHHFENLSSKQKKLFELFFENYSFKQIADILNFKNAAYARKEKYICKTLLIEKIKNDPQFEELQKMQMEM